MKPEFFTVVLLYPDYATGDFGADVYIGSARAKDGYAATGIVQRRAHREVDNHGSRIPADDFRPILVFRGDLPVELDATSF